jgi:hypothetical protein
MRQPLLDLEDIQGDVLVGLQKDAENFIFFKILNPEFFKVLINQCVVGTITSAQQTKHRELVILHGKKSGQNTLIRCTA